MNSNHMLRSGICLAALLAVSSIAVTAPKLPKAGEGASKVVTVMAMGDLHGTLVSHQAVLKNPDGTERFAYDAGGLAKLKTIVNGIRADNPNNLLLSVGDLTHGSAEVLYTVGDAMMRPINAFAIDVFTPGNWDFGYGPAVFRGRFTPADAAVPPNIAVMTGYLDCAGDLDCVETSSGIIKANFKTSAINLYNVSPPLPAGAHHSRVFPKNFEMFEMDGAKVAVVGITAAIVPQQADVFNIGLRFTQGIDELEVAIKEARAEGANIVVVQSELGLSQNLEIARSLPIDVMYSAHTHEVTSGALLALGDEVMKTNPEHPLSGGAASLLARGATIVIETNRDMYVGRLDLHVVGGRIINFDWEAIPVDDEVKPDHDMVNLVTEIEALFTKNNPNLTFMPGGYCPGGPCTGIETRGLRLTDSLDTVVGRTGQNTLLLRHHVLEDVLNNFIADAILYVTNAAVVGSDHPTWTGVDLSMTNGFRFGNAVLPNSDITMRDLYTWFPIGPAVNVADFSGKSVEESLDVILGAVFNRNVFLQRGGWYLGLANMTQKLDLKNRPFSSSGGRIVETMISAEPLDPSKRYVFASCYPHGDPLDQVCRTPGGANHMFFELANANDYSSDIRLVDPVNSTGIVTLRVPPPPTVIIKQVAPDRFLHPVHILRRCLDNPECVGNYDRTVYESDYAIGRIQTVDSTIGGNPAEDENLQIKQVPDNTPDDTLVQPTFGAGPKFFSGRIGD